MGILVLLLPFYKISIWILIAQGIIAFCLFLSGAKLLLAWEDKKIKRNILLSKNRDEFRPDTFEVFVQSPCGRLLVRSVLSELDKSSEYKKILKMKKPLWAVIKENIKPVKTTIYINENIK
ncbi:MAG: hypothetical protein FWD87_04845 [Spirochaetaceae bacterium]|nr:hypothetical protein [Spirochaetaceae bacterium]